MNRETPFDAGWANGWLETPVIIKECREKGHKTVETKGPYKCTHIVKCPICRYRYMYDSSD